MRYVKGIELRPSVREDEFVGWEGLEINKDTGVGVFTG